VVNITNVIINGNVQTEINFDSDPQNQIKSAENIAKTAKHIADTAQGTANYRSIVRVGNVKTDVDFTSDPQTQIDNRSTVKINNVRADVNFTSDPQTQIDNLANNDGNVSKFYPIGSVYISVLSTNPLYLFGGGTWKRFGNGRVLVGVDENDEDFRNGTTSGEEQSERTGGTKTVELTAAQIAAHSHPITINEGGLHSHVYDRPYKTSGGLYGSGQGLNETNGANSVDSGQHTHSASVGSAGQGQAHNNLQPYITVYMWVRTA